MLVKSVNVNDELMSFNGSFFDIYLEKTRQKAEILF